MPGSTEWSYWGVSNFSIDGVAATSSGVPPAVGGVRMLITQHSLRIITEGRR